MRVNEYVAHPTALVESDRVGPGTRIWAYVHILEGAVIGSGCNIGDHCFVERKVHIGNDVVVKNGVCLWEGVTLEDRVFVGPNVAFANDVYPRAKVYHDEYDCTHVREGASIGANATVLPGIVIGRYALVGAGSVVTKDVPDFALVRGNPARHRGWVCRCGQRLSFRDNRTSSTKCRCGRSYILLDGRVTEVYEGSPLQLAS